MIDAAKLPPELRPLLAEERLNELGPGAPNMAMRGPLEQIERDLPARAEKRDFALACVAGLWLYHDFLDESHAISQDLGTVEGSYWHAIMHRREPDPWNSKYWFRRVGIHPIFAELAKDARTLNFALRSERWSPEQFIDACEEQRGSNSLEETMLRRLQKREWELLFEWCCQHAFMNSK